jgi:preprotein translocase subunit SecE
MSAPMNRQAKRMMAKQGTDKPRATERRPSAAPQRERTGPVQYYREVVAEMKKVAWPTRPEVINSSVVVVVGVVVMAALIFGFDYLSIHLVDFIFG